MKDAYSFDLDESGAKISYQKIVRRLHSHFHAMRPDLSGRRRGYRADRWELSHEFMVFAETGEETVVYSDPGGYAANLERAEVLNAGWEWTCSAASHRGQHPATTDCRRSDRIFEDCRATTGQNSPVHGRKGSGRHSRPW